MAGFKKKKGVLKKKEMCNLVKLQHHTLKVGGSVLIESTQTQTRLKLKHGAGKLKHRAWSIHSMFKF